MPPITWTFYSLDQYCELATVKCGSQTWNKSHGLSRLHGFKKGNYYWTESSYWLGMNALQVWMPLDLCILNSCQELRFLHKYVHILKPILPSIMSLQQCTIHSDLSLDHNRHQRVHLQERTNYISINRNKILNSTEKGFCLEKVGTVVVNLFILCYKASGITLHDFRFCR